MKLAVKVENVTYQLDVDELQNGDVIDLEDVTGLTFTEWLESLQKGSLKALTGVIWLARRENEPDLAFRDVTFRLSAVSVVMDDEETADPGKEQPAQT